MASYMAAKRGCSKRMTASDVAMLNADDPTVPPPRRRSPPRRISFPRSRILDEGMGFDGSSSSGAEQAGRAAFRSAELQIKGQHNLENVMAALIPPLVEGCPPAARLGGGLRLSRAATPHEPGARPQRRAWYNDSKGTNVGSVVKSLAGSASAGDADRRRQGQGRRLCPTGRADSPPRCAT